MNTLLANRRWQGVTSRGRQFFQSQLFDLLNVKLFHLVAGHPERISIMGFIWCEIAILGILPRPRHLSML